MQPLAAILHIFIGATLSGVAVVVALVMGATSFSVVLAAAALGFLVAIPCSAYIAKQIDKLR